MSNDITYRFVAAERAPEALARYEKIIEEGFIKAGQAFKVIKVFKLWQDNIYTNFEDYCQRRWKHNRRTINRMIQHSDIALELGSIDPNLAESAIRELVPLPSAEFRREVMEEVLKQNPKPTALEVRKEVEKKLVEILPLTDTQVRKITNRSIKTAEKRFSKLWIEFRDVYSNIPLSELDVMAIRVIQNH